MFENFKKRKLIQLSDKTMEELVKEFDKEKQTYALLGSSEMYEFLVEYFQARIEINRDRIEILDPLKEPDRLKMVQPLAENRVMRDFITDINNMKKITELPEEEIKN